MLSRTYPVFKHFQGQWISKTEFKHFKWFFKHCMNPDIQITCKPLNIISWWFNLLDTARIHCHIFSHKSQILFVTSLCNNSATEIIQLVTHANHCVTSTVICISYHPDYRVQRWHISSFIQHRMSPEVYRYSLEWTSDDIFRTALQSQVNCYWTPFIQESAFFIRQLRASNHENKQPKCRSRK